MGAYENGVRVLGVTDADVPNTITLDNITQITTRPLTSLTSLPGILPQGMLTLTSGTPVLTGAVATAATVYYTPAVGFTVPIYDGSNFIPTAFTELSNVLANSATGKAGPAAAIAASNYDLFVWSDSGTVRLTRGPLWTSDTGRGTGAGTTEIARVSGIFTNVVAITNGPGAGLGTYVGTVRTDAGGATVSWSLGGNAAGGTPATLNVFNAYNQQDRTPSVSDSTAATAYGAGTWRAMNASNSNRISYIDGLGTLGVTAEFQCALSLLGANSAYGAISIDIDGTADPPLTAGASAGLTGNTATGAVTGALLARPVAHYSGIPGLGFHYLQMVQLGDALNNNEFGGSSHCNLGARLRL